MLTLLAVALPQTTTPSNMAMDGDDAELARAIAASLQAEQAGQVPDIGESSTVGGRYSAMVEDNDSDENDDEDDDDCEYQSGEDDDDFGVEDAMQMDDSDEPPVLNVAPNGVNIHEAAQQLMGLAGMEDLDQAKQMLALFNYDINSAAASMLDGGAPLERVSSVDGTKGPPGAEFSSLYEVPPSP